MVVNAVELLYLVPVANTLGEGVLWNERTQTIWWTDIEEKRLFEHEPATGVLKSRDMPYRVACFGFIEDDDRLIVAFDRGIACYSPEDGSVEWLAGPGILPEGVRFNDGRIDPQGRFWVGSMVEEPGVPADAAALYCYEPAGGLVERLRGISISNGLCWSPDGTVMYHADSPRNRIFAYGFDARTGVPSGRRTFAETPPGVHPDGSVTDADGGLWNAQWGGGRVVRYTADGRVDVVVETPVSQPSCVAFAGPDLDLLVVTSARAGLTAERLAAEPGAGDLHVYRTTFTGLAACRFRMRPADPPGAPSASATCRTATGRFPLCTSR